jgi:hypothetical protein
LTFNLKNAKIDVSLVQTVKSATHVNKTLISMIKESVNVKRDFYFYASLTTCALNSLLALTTFLTNHKGNFLMDLRTLKLELQTSFFLWSTIQFPSALSSVNCSYEITNMLRTSTL